MNYSIKRATATALLCLSFSAQAEILTEAVLEGQVQQFIDGGVVTSCGVVITGHEVIQDTPSGSLLIFSGSFSLETSSLGMVKGTASEIDAKFLNSSNLQNHIKRLRVEDVWMKSPNAARTSTIKNTSILRGQNPLSAIYPATSAPIVALLNSIMSKEQIQIGVRVTERQSAQVLFGVVKMTDAQTLQLSQCIGELLDAISKKHNFK